ncbi:MAG: methyltransferase domain-containing protein [Thermoplasmata archaeon]|nr:methyltransferase domain-containing protein [Thermoplasmata archaeon]
MSRLERDCYERMQYREGHIDDILSLLYPQLTKPLNECTVLDMGCGVGGLSIPASFRVKEIRGIDVDESYISICKQSAKEKGLTNATFEVKSLFDLDEKDAYDVVLCSDVLEHVEDQEGVLRNIVRTLKVGGVFYLTTNNKCWPMEGHYGLLFLSYQSREKALRRVIRKGKGKVYNIYPLSYGNLKQLLSKYPIEYEFKAPRNPDKFIYKMGSGMVKLTSYFWNFSNAFQIIGKKRSSLEG